MLIDQSRETAKRGRGEQRVSSLAGVYGKRQMKLTNVCGKVGLRYGAADAGGSMHDICLQNI